VLTRGLSADALRAQLQERAIPVGEIERIEPSLEDVFIHLAGTHGARN
jgi:hypothetical protein